MQTTMKTRSMVTVAKVMVMVVEVLQTTSLTG